MADVARLVVVERGLCHRQSWFMAPQPATRGLSSANRLVVLRAVVTFSLAAAAALIGYGCYYFLRDFQQSLDHAQYNALANKIEKSTVEAMWTHRYAMINVASTAAFLYPNASMWPNTAIPGTYFEKMVHPLIRMANSRNILIGNIITSAQVPSFEAFAARWLNESGYLKKNPAIGSSSFGRGIYAINSTTGTRYHSTVPWPPAKRDILVPCMNAAITYTAFMFNFYSERRRSDSIDYSIECALAATDAGDNCSSTSDAVFLVNDLAPRPGSLFTHPIKLSDGNVVGIATTAFNWDAAFTTAINSRVSGLYLVLAFGTVHCYSYSVHDGVVTYLGEGDYHDRHYDQRRHSFLVTDFGGPQRFYLHVYPSEEWVRLYESELPALLCGVTVGILALTALVFLFYDYLMSRASLKKDLVLQTKQQFVRYISHEIRTPSNIVQLGFKLLYSEMFALNATLRDDPSCPASVLTAFRDWLDLVSDIAESADAAIVVLNDLINYDKLHMGKLQLEVEPLFIWDVLGPAVQPFTIQARHAGVQLEVHVDGTDQEHAPAAGVDDDDKMQAWAAVRDQIVLGDVAKLNQVIRNLISNAIKFTPSGGKVIVRATWKQDGLSAANPIPVLSDDKAHAERSPCDYVRCGSISMAVRDSGAGMSPEQLRALFQEGVQFNANQLQAGGGSGLGLWIAKGIVEMHQGALSASSDGEGLGCTFTLELPLVCCPASEGWSRDRHEVLPNLPLNSPAATVVAAEDDGAVAPLMKGVSMFNTDDCVAKAVPATSAAATNVTPPPGHVRNVLVVDDSVLSRKMVCRLLRRVGYTCFEAGDGQECVDKVLQARDGAHPPIDVVLMDFEMPRMNGPTATAVLRSLGVDVPVVGITGNVLSEDKDAFLAKGALCVLTKPLEPGMLMELMQQFAVPDRDPVNDNALSTAAGVYLGDVEHADPYANGGARD